MGRYDAPSEAKPTGGGVAVDRNAVDVDAGGEFGERRRGCYERAHGAEHFHAGAVGIEAFEREFGITQDPTAGLQMDIDYRAIRRVA